MNINEYIDNFKIAYEGRQNKLHSLEDYVNAAEQEIKEDAYYYFGSGEDIEELGESKALELYIGRLLLEADGDAKRAFKEYSEDLSHDNIEDCYEGEKAVYNLLEELAYKEAVAEIFKDYLDEEDKATLYEDSISDAIGEYIYDKFNEEFAYILNTNLEFSQWVNVLYDQRMTTALIGRLTHHVELILFPGINNRLRESSINETLSRISNQEVKGNGG